MVELIKKEVVITKEASEIFELIRVLVNSIKDGNDISLIISECLTPLIAAIEGFSELPAEVKNQAFFATAGLGLGDIVEVLLRAKEDLD